MVGEYIDKLIFFTRYHKKNPSAPHSRRVCGIVYSGSCGVLVPLGFLIYDRDKYWQRPSSPKTKKIKDLTRISFHLLRLSDCCCKEKVGRYRDELEKKVSRILCLKLIPVLTPLCFLIEYFM